MCILYAHKLGSGGNMVGERQGSPSLSIDKARDKVPIDTLADVATRQWIMYQ